MNNRLTFQQSNYGQPNLQFNNIQHNYVQPNNVQPNYNRTVIPNPRIQTATYNVNNNQTQPQFRQQQQFNTQQQLNVQPNNLRFNNGQPRGCGCGGAI